MAMFQGLKFLKQLIPRKSLTSITNINKIRYRYNHCNKLLLQTHQHDRYSTNNNSHSGLDKLPNQILISQIKNDASLRNASLTFKDMIKFSELYDQYLNSDENNIFESAHFVRKQLLILLSSIICDFEHLPYKVNENERVKEIMNLYLESYDVIKSLQNIKTHEGKNEFNKIIAKYMTMGSRIVPKLIIGLKEMGQQQQSPLYKIEECPYLTNFIDIIIKRRLAIRTLLGHYLSLHDTHWGIFEKNCDIINYIETAINDSEFLTNETYGNHQIIPNINILDMRKYEVQNFTFIPEIIHKCVFELIKNSIRATIEFNDDNKNNEDDVMNDINIIVINSKIDGQITIKVEDKGGGISRGDINKVWFYSYTSSNVNDINGKSQMELLKQMDVKPMYGLGYGLPVLSAEIQYFGGNCEVHSVDGYGTDAYLFLPNLALSKRNSLEIN